MRVVLTGRLLSAFERSNELNYERNRRGHGNRRPGYRPGMVAIGRGVSPVFAPALTIGIGLGGFIDGIVLHQILGWHHMLSARTGFDMRANELADGLFHAACGSSSWRVCSGCTRDCGYPRSPRRGRGWRAVRGPGRRWWARC
jgi:hypothetical protein